MVNTEKLEKQDLKEKYTKTSRDVSLSDKDALDKVCQRHDEMQRKRSENESLWDYIDATFKAKPKFKVNWQVSPNLKIEEALIEASIGMQDAQIPINVESDGKTDGIMLNLAKYALDHFIYKEKIEQEVRLHMDYSRARYWTAILYSWMELKSKFVASENNNWYFNPKWEVERIEELHVRIKDVPIRNAYFDDTARRWEDCVDCIYEEFLSVDEYKLRYLDDNGKSKPYFTNAENVWVVSPSDDPTYKWDQIISWDMVKVWHYFNKLYAKYIIVVNEKVVIYNGLASTRHWELPLIPVQFYNNPYSIYGIGIPERYATVKAVNKNFYSAAIWGAWLNAWSAIITWEWQDIDWDIYIEPWEVSIIELTKGTARDITPFNANINVQQLVDMINLMDDMWSYLTWVNIKAPYTSPAKTAFETSVMKEEQNNRLKTIHETRSLWLEDAFTLMLSNIFTFLPYQYMERPIDEQEKLWNFYWYQVPVKDRKIYRNEETWEITSIEEQKWYTDYFDLDPKIVEGARGMKVRIVTPATASTMKALEVENLTKYLQAKQMVEWFKIQAMQTWGDVEQWEKISERLDMLFNIDKRNIDINSWEQDLRNQTAEITALLNQFTFKPEDEALNEMAMWTPIQSESSSNWEEEIQQPRTPSDPLQQSI